MQKTTLSNLQVELLQMFKYDLPESQLLELKKILCDYFAKVTSDEADKLWDKNSWTDATMDSWANEHLRSKQ
jgi:hypothetical protein